MGPVGTSGCPRVCWFVRLLGGGVGCCVRVLVERYWIVVARDCIFFSLGLIGGGKGSDLCPECVDVLLQRREASCHRDLYLSKIVFQIVVAIV